MAIETIKVNKQGKAKAVLQTEKMPAKKQAPTNNFLSPEVGFSFKNPVVIGLALAVITAVTLLVARGATLSSVEESVRLSNGKEVHLGEPTSQLVAELRTDLNKVNGQLFQYPSNRYKPVEVIILAENGIVSAIQIIRTGNNVLSSSGIAVGNTQTQIAARLGSRLAPLEASLLNLNRRGVQLNQTRSTAYLLKPSCGRSDQINTITIALKDYASKLTSKALVADCNVSKD